MAVFLKGDNMGEIPLFKRIRESVGNSLIRLDSLWTRTVEEVGSRIPRGVTLLGGLTIGTAVIAEGFGLSCLAIHEPSPLRETIVIGASLGTAISLTVTTVTTFAMAQARDATRKSPKG